MNDFGVTSLVEKKLRWAAYLAFKSNILRYLSMFRQKQYSSTLAFSMPVDMCPI